MSPKNSTTDSRSKSDPFDDPKLFRRTSCQVCTDCYVSVQYGRCMFGGPYTGYVWVGRPEDNPEIKDRGDIKDIENPE